MAAAAPGGAQGRLIARGLPHTMNYDLNRHDSYPHASFFKLFQGVRQECLPFFKHPEVVSAMEPKMDRTIVVGSQFLRVYDQLDHAQDAPVGELSLSLRGRSLCNSERLFQGGRLIASNAVILLIVSHSDGKSRVDDPPREVVDMCTPTSSAEHEFLRHAVEAMPKTPPASAFCIPAVVRFSDEDRYKHANHSFFGRLFEDAKETIVADPSSPAELRVVAERSMEAMFVAYMAEAFAPRSLGGPRCLVTAVDVGYLGASRGCSSEGRPTRCSRQRACLLQGC